METDYILLVRADVLAWAGLSQPTGELVPEAEDGVLADGGQVVRQQSQVYWCVQGLSTVAAFLVDEEVSESLMKETDFHDNFNDAFKELAGHYDWWSLYPVAVHPDYRKAIVDQLDRVVSSWSSEELYAAENDSPDLYAWRVRLGLAR